MLAKQIVLPAIVLALLGVIGPSSDAAPRRVRPAEAATPVHAGVPLSHIHGNVITVAGHPLHWAHARVFRLVNGHRRLVVVKLSNVRGQFVTHRAAGTFLIEVTHRNGSRASAVVTTSPGKVSTVTFHMHKTFTHASHNSFNLGIHRLATPPRRRPAGPATAAPAAPRKVGVPHPRIVGTVLNARGKPLRGAYARIIRISGGRHEQVALKGTGPRGHFFSHPVAGTYLIEVTHHNGSRALATVTTVPGQTADVVFHMHGMTTHPAHNSLRLGIHNLGSFTSAGHAH